MYELNVSGADTVTLPDDKGLIILAASQSQDSSYINLETALYDRIKERKFDFKMSAKEKRAYKRHKIIEKKTPNKS